MGIKAFRKAGRGRDDVPVVHDGSGFDNVVSVVFPEKCLLLERFEIGCFAGARVLHAGRARVRTPQGP